MATVNFTNAPAITHNELSIARHIAIENALSMALWHVRHNTGTTSLQAATGRAMRATAMLEQACVEFANGGGAAVGACHQ